MNNFRKTTWEDAKGQDVWIKLPDGTMEKLTWTVGRYWLDSHCYAWGSAGSMLRLATPYLQTTEAVEITLPEAVERAMKGLPVVDENGVTDRWSDPAYFHITDNSYRYFIPAIDETVEVTVTLPADLRDDFLKGISSFRYAKVKE